LVIGQMNVDDKNNEINAIPTPIRELELAGCIVTPDAMGCQNKAAREIKEDDSHARVGHAGQKPLSQDASLRETAGDTTRIQEETKTGFRCVYPALTSR
jgi:predicted transposase YbfD/YdcC